MPKYPKFLYVTEECDDGVVSAYDDPDLIAEPGEKIVVRRYVYDVLVEITSKTVVTEKRVTKRKAV